MGINPDYLEFILHANNGDVSFERTATIARLRMYISLMKFKKTLQKFGHTLSDEEILRIRSSSGGYAETFLEYLGAKEIVSVDASDFEDATVAHDFNLPIPSDLKGKFTAVIEGGTLEHIFNFPMAIKNCMEMLEVGGTFFGVMPGNNYMGHGFYQLSPEIFYRVFTPSNGFELVKLLAREKRAGKTKWYSVNDPCQVKRRVELINSYQVDLFVHARKINSNEVFTTTPQQSDYAAAWAGTEKSPTVVGLRQQVTNLVKPYNAIWLRYLPSFLYDRIRLALLSGFRKGQFQRTELRRN